MRLADLIAADIGADGTTEIIGHAPLRRASEMLSLGPGGTDMAHCWREARARWPRRQCVIVTDGETPWPADACDAILTRPIDVPPNVRVLRVLRAR